MAVLKHLAGLTLSAVAICGTAHAANTFSGTYSVRYTTLCQSIENEVFKPITQVNTISLGKISQTVGVITFTPSAAGALSGAVSINATQSNGSLTILGLPGPPVTPAAPDMVVSTGKPQAGSFSFKPMLGGGPSTLTIMLAGETPEVFLAYVSKPKNGAFTHADFIAIDGAPGKPPSCSNSGSIDQ
jgi:hypothetical protein